MSNIPPPPSDKYVVRGADGKDYPVDYRTLKAWIASGKITPDHQIYSEATGKWSRMADLPGLAAVAPAKPTAAKSMCGVAVALFLFSIALGMMNMGKGLSMLLVAGAFICGIIGAVLYAMKK